MQKTAAAYYTGTHVDRRGVLRGYARTSDEECLARMWVCTIEIDKTQISRFP